MATAANAIMATWSQSACLISHQSERLRLPPPPAAAGLPQVTRRPHPRPQDPHPAAVALGLVEQAVPETPGAAHRRGALVVEGDHRGGDQFLPRSPGHRQFTFLAGLAGVKEV